MKAKKLFKIMSFALIFMLLFMPIAETTAFASSPFDENFDVNIGPNGVNVTGQTDSTSAWRTLLDKYKNVITIVSAIAAVTFVIFFIMNFLKLGASADNPQARSRALSGLLWTGLGAAGLGAVSIIMGIFYNVLA